MDESQAADAPRASLVVGFVPGVTPAKWVRNWRERLPEIPLELVALPSDAIIASLASGRIDVALARLPLEHETPDDAEAFAVIRLYEETIVVVAPKDHAFDAVETVEESMLDGETVLDRDGTELRAGRSADVVDLVAANVGIAIVPQSIARLHSRRDVVARPLRGAAPTEVALAWVREHTNASIEEFAGIVRGRTARSSRGSAADEREADGRSTASTPARSVRKKPEAKKVPQRYAPSPRKLKAQQEAARKKRRGR